MAQFYEKLIAHLDNFEKNRLTEVAEKSITVMSSEENTNYESKLYKKKKKLTHIM